MHGKAEADDRSKVQYKQIIYLNSFFGGCCIRSLSTDWGSHRRHTNGIFKVSSCMLASRSLVVFACLAIAIAVGKSNNFETF